MDTSECFDGESTWIHQELLFLLQFLLHFPFRDSSLSIMHTLHALNLSATSSITWLAPEHLQLEHPPMQILIWKMSAKLQSELELEVGTF